MIQAIAAMAENRVIGHNNCIPWHLPEDFRWFKQKTMGGILIMGRKTFESIGSPLPGRETWVLSRQSSTIPGARLFSDIRSCRDAIKQSSNPSVYICGGAEVYRQFLAECELLYLTVVKSQAQGDAFFPEFESGFILKETLEDHPTHRIDLYRSRKTRT